MSQWMKVAVKVDNLNEEVLNEALKRMGIYANFNMKRVSSNYENNGSQSCDCVLCDLESGASMNIGLVFKITKTATGSKIDMEAFSDWWLTEWTEESFANALRMEYVTANTIINARKQGFELVEEVEEESVEGRRKLVFSRVA